MLTSLILRPYVEQTIFNRLFKLQICKALEAIWEFSDVMENYLDEKGSSVKVISFNS